MKACIINAHHPTRIGGGHRVAMAEAAWPVPDALVARDPNRDLVAR